MCLVILTFVQICDLRDFAERVECVQSARQQHAACFYNNVQIASGEQNNTKTIKTKHGLNTL
jgi:hypothetical protein